MIWLGKIAEDQQSGIHSFQIGDPGVPYDPLVMRAVMRFLADNMGSTLRVWSEEMLDRNITGEYIEIGGDEASDISLADYLRNPRP
jgi:hypothetical protein